MRFILVSFYMNSFSGFLPLTSNAIRNSIRQIQRLRSSILYQYHLVSWGRFDTHCSDSINWQPENINMGNNCRQGTSDLTPFLLRITARVRRRTALLHENATMNDFCYRLKYRLCHSHPRRQLLAGLEHKKQLKSTTCNEPYIKPEAETQPQTGTTTIGTTQKVVVNTSKASPHTQFAATDELWVKQSVVTCPIFLPQRYEHANPLDLVTVISTFLTQLICDNEVPLETHKLTRFHSKTVPQMSIYGYLERLTINAALPSPILLGMIAYVERFCKAHPALNLSCLTVHRIMLACSTVVTKSLSDCFWANKEYARIGGVCARELTFLKLELLEYLGWDIMLQTGQLAEIYSRLIRGDGRYEIEAGAGGR